MRSHPFCAGKLSQRCRQIPSHRPKARPSLQGRCANAAGRSAELGWPRLRLGNQAQPRQPQAGALTIPKGMQRKPAKRGMSSGTNDGPRIAGWQASTEWRRGGGVGNRRMAWTDELVSLICSRPAMAKGAATSDGPAWTMRLLKQQDPRDLLGWQIGVTDWRRCELALTFWKRDEETAQHPLHLLQRIGLCDKAASCRLVGIHHSRCQKHFDLGTCAGKPSGQSDAIHTAWHLHV